jgi:hypothetical protein
MSNPQQYKISLKSNNYNDNSDYKNPNGVYYFQKNTESPYDEKRVYSYPSSANSMDKHSTWSATSSAISNSASTTFSEDKMKDPNETQIRVVVR